MVGETSSLGVRDTWFWIQKLKKKKKDPCPGGGYRLKNTHFQYQVVTAKVKISTGPSLGGGGVAGEWFKACLLELYGIGVKKVRKVLRMEGATCLRHKGTNRMVAWKMSLTLWLGFHSLANSTQIYISGRLLPLSTGHRHI